MKLNRRNIRALILNEMRIINENDDQSVAKARSAIIRAALDVQMKGTKMQQGFGHIIEKMCEYLAKDEITDKDITALKSYIDSVDTTYFSEK